MPAACTLRAGCLANLEVSFLSKSDLFYLLSLLLETFLKFLNYLKDEKREIFVHFKGGKT